MPSGPDVPGLLQKWSGGEGSGGEGSNHAMEAGWVSIRDWGWSARGRHGRKKTNRLQFTNNDSPLPLSAAAARLAPSGEFLERVSSHLVGERSQLP